jgi:hypothetical protein
MKTKIHKELRDMSRAEYEARLRKVQQRIKITFEGAQDRAAVLPSLIGGTYLRGEVASGLTKHQVAYRQALARKLYGLPKGMGFAKQWRNGTSQIPFIREMQQDMLISVSAMLARELPKRRLHPTGEVNEDETA